LPSATAVPADGTTVAGVVNYPGDYDYFTFNALADRDTSHEVLDVDYFVCGHQPQEMGYDVLHERMLILAGDHNHGVFLPIDLKKPVSIDGLCKQIRPFAGVA
jgi:hypothetical protein